MDSIAQATVKAGADLGVIFDTDVDRGGAVDREGKEINRNRLVALASAIALENCPGGTIVTDSITSDGLKEYIERTLGGRHYRYQRGYKNVINKALELKRPRGGLPPGHRDQRPCRHAGQLFSRRRRLPGHPDHHQAGQAPPGGQGFRGPPGPPEGAHGGRRGAPAHPGQGLPGGGPVPHRRAGDLRPGPRAGPSPRTTGRGLRVSLPPGGGGMAGSCCGCLSTTPSCP